jgi:hypothetical protein
VADFLRSQTGLKLAELDYVTLEAIKASLQPKAKGKSKAPGASGGAKKRKAVAGPEEGGEE